MTLSNIFSTRLLLVGFAVVKCEQQFSDSSQNQTPINRTHFTLRNNAHLDLFFQWQNCLILFFFSLIVIVSLCGNLYVCRNVLTQRRLRTNSTNVLIVVLAISDLIMTIFNIPFTVGDMIFKDWIFGSFLCTLVSFVQANSVYVSSFTMAVIAINRWRIVYKFRPKATSVSANDAANVTISSAASDRMPTNRITLVINRATSNRCCGRRCLSLLFCRKNPIELESTELQRIESPAQLYATPTSPPTYAKVKLFKLKANSRLALIIFAIWLAAALHSLPHTVFNRVKTIEISKYPLDLNNISNATNVNHGDRMSTGTNDDDDANSSSSSGRKVNDPQHVVVSFRRCIPVWPEKLGSNFNIILTLFTTTTQYFIPLSCAGIIYTQIGFTIMSQGKVGAISPQREEQLSKKKRRRIFMLIFICLQFALCWLPFNVYYLLLDTGVTKSNFASFLVCLWLAMSSVCWNPFVYAWSNMYKERE